MGLPTTTSCPGEICAPRHRYSLEELSALQLVDDIWGIPDSGHFFMGGGTKLLVLVESADVRHSRFRAAW
jgi:hypothetical protein